MVVNMLSFRSPELALGSDTAHKGDIYDHKLSTMRIISPLYRPPENIVSTWSGK